MTELQEYDPLQIDFGRQFLQNTLELARDPEQSEIYNLLWHKDRLTLEFGADFATKMQCSGADYTISLPSPGADFRIQDEGEWFVSYLRGAVRNGGFRGAPGDWLGCSAGEWEWVPPPSALIEKLAADLLPL